MGHGGFMKIEYEAYLRRLETSTIALPMPDHPAARAAWQEILEILLTPEQARFAACVSPTRRLNAEEMARRAGLPADRARKHLDALADRGIVYDMVNPRTGAVKWLLAPRAQVPRATAADRYAGNADRGCVRDCRGLAGRERSTR